MLKFAPHITVTNSSYRFIVSEQLQSVGIDPGPILIEPEAKNTAPAIIAATILAYKENKDAIIISSPSDHIINDEKYHSAAIRTGLSDVNNKKIVTFGIKHTYPDKGYGYLQLEQFKNEGPKKVISSDEKPD